MSFNQDDSQRPPSQPAVEQGGFSDLTCSKCGERAVGRPGSLCSACRGVTKSSGDDMLRKTFDEPDLMKGGR